MKKISVIISLLLIVFFYSCDEIGESDRLKDAPLPEVKKNVLLVDFTGQRCPNCPAATEEAKALKKKYGENLVVVAMHAGGLSIDPAENKEGLKTKAGQNYYDSFDVRDLPTGFFDWGSLSTEPSSWPALTIARLEKESPVDLTLDATYDNATRELSVKANIRGVKNTDNMRLLLWLTESKIIAIQFFPNNGRDREYEHNHVFRDVINGQWGTGEDGKETGSDISILIAEEKEYLITGYTLSEEWKPENMTVIGFLYKNSKTKEVLQTIEIPLIEEVPDN